MLAMSRLLRWSHLKKKPIVIAYDISDNPSRRQVHKILKEWRIDGQKSVHECYLNQWEAEELFLQLGAILNQKTDHLLMTWLDGRRKGLARGQGRVFAFHPLRQIR